MLLVLGESVHFCTKDDVIRRLLVHPVYEAEAISLVPYFAEIIIFF